MGARMMKQSLGVAPSKTFMDKNTGRLFSEPNVTEKQYKQQLREQREAQFMQQSVAAKILAQRQKV